MEEEEEGEEAAVGVEQEAGPPQAMGEEGLWRLPTPFGSPGARGLRRGNTQNIWMIINIISFFITIFIILFTFYKNHLFMSCRHVVFFVSLLK